MRLNVERHGTATVVRPCEPRLDAAVALAFKEAMRRAAADAGARLVLALGAVDFLDSSGLGAVVSSARALRPDQALALAAPGPEVARVFRLTRMDRLFPLHPDVETALAAGRDG